MFRKILVAVDETDYSQKAIAVATDMAKHYDCELCLVHAFDHVADHLGSPAYDDLLEVRTMNGHDLLDKMRRRVNPEIPVETQLIEGPPASAILRVAETEGFDLIVMGSRGHGQFVSLLVGSVSNVVSKRANCPVMIVH